MFDVLAGRAKAPRHILSARRVATKKDARARQIAAPQ